MSQTAKQNTVRRSAPTSEQQPLQPARESAPDDGFPVPGDGSPGKPPSTSPKKL